MMTNIVAAQEEALGSDPAAIQRTAPGTTLPDTLEWDYDPNVLWYRLWAGDDPYVGRGIHPGAQGWLAAQDICDVTTCTLDVSAFDFTPGDYEWWMEALGEKGSKSFSSPSPWGEGNRVRAFQTAS
jgi:hypothetical protein